jgi:hypothetical protein
VNKYYNISAGVKMRNNCRPERKKKKLFLSSAMGGCIESEASFEYKFVVRP